jgi:hypothetical protein
MGDATPVPENAESLESGVNAVVKRKGMRLVCDRCGNRMFEDKCKMMCPNCGGRFDCSDLNLNFD